MYVADAKRYSKVPVRSAGNSGLKLPAISLGLWRHFGSEDPVDARREVILHAFDRGVFHFDLANHYGNGQFNNGWGTAEELFGQIYQNDLRPYRDELVISTKVGYAIHEGPYGNGTSRKAIMQGIDDSLRRLHMDYVDLYYAHRFDDTVDLEETVRALDDVVRAGKALYIGVSNYETPQAREAIRLFKDLGTPFVVNQMSYNMFNRNVETSGLVDEMKAANKGIVSYGPLAEGLLSDRYLKAIPETFPIHPTNKAIFKDGREAVVAKLNQLNDLAKSRSQTLSQMALAWLLRDPVVTTVLIGTTNVDHLDDNLAACNNMTFSADELKKIDAIIG